jgi:hypothetical protein
VLSFRRESVFAVEPPGANPPPTGKRGAERAARGDGSVPGANFLFRGCVTGPQAHGSWEGPRLQSPVPAGPEGGFRLGG